MTATVPRRVRGIDLPPYDPLNLRAAALRAAGHDVVSLGQALPFFGPPASALAAARAALDTREVNIYSTDPGMPALRSALADRLRSVGVTATADDLIVTAGGNHAFTLGLTTMVDPGDEVVTHAPYWPTIPEQVKLVGGVPVIVQTSSVDGFTVKADAIIAAMTPGTKAVILNSPGNPTGALIDESVVAAVAEECARRGVWLVVDLCYEQLIYESVPHNLKVLGQDLERNFKTLLQSGIERMELVSREEFDVQRAVLERTRAKLETMEARLAELEKALSSRS